MGQWFNTPGSNLATAARETGYPVVEVDGWQQRGHRAMSDHVGAVVCHHTASCEPHETSSNAPALNVVRDGRAGLPGPLSHYVLGFDGTIYVVAAGLAYHAGPGGWAGMSGNGTAIGIEAEDSGDGDWTAAQLDAYPRLVARLCQFLGITADAVCGHKEWAPSRKVDPAGIDMSDFRRQVADYLARPHAITATQPGGSDVSYEDAKRAITDVLWGDRHPSRVPGAETDVSLADAILWADSYGYRNHKTLARQIGSDELRPMLADIVGPIVRDAVTTALGTDNQETADVIVDDIAQRLAN